MICTQPHCRTHSLRSYSEWSSQYHQENFRHLANSTLFSASPLCLEFWRINWCQILLSLGSWFSIRDILMLPRIELIIKGLQKLSLPSFNSIAFPSLSLHGNLAFEFDIVYRTWTRWWKPAASLHSGSTFCLQQSCSAQILLELYQHFALSLQGWRFSTVKFGAARLSSSHFFYFS